LLLVVVIGCCCCYWLLLLLVVVVIGCCWLSADDVLCENRLQGIYRSIKEPKAGLRDFFSSFWG